MLRKNFILAPLLFAVCLFSVAACSDDTPQQKNTAKTTPATAQAITIPGWDMAKLKALPYAAVKADKEHRAAINRTKLDIRIVLAEKSADGKISPLSHHENVSKEQLAATVIAAAKYYAQKTGADFVSVVLDSQFGTDFGVSQLASAQYAPDGKGVSGKDNWTWQLLRVVEHGMTARELEAQHLWGELRGQYQTPQGTTDEAALTAAIAKKMGVTEKEADVPYMMPENIPVDVAGVVEAMAGLEQK